MGGPGVGVAAREEGAGRFILNCEPSAGVDGDWTVKDALAAEVVSPTPVDGRRQGAG